MDVVVKPHDPRWPDLFSAQSSRVRRALGSNVRSVHHIGSTAIPGVHAKPIIDILVVVDDIEQVDRRSHEMQAIGYQGLGEYGIPGRRYYRRNDRSGRRVSQVHGFASASAEIGRHLAFRDFLRAHAHWATQYSQLKRTLAEAHPHDIEAYMDGKDGFIKCMDRKAAAWLAAQDV